jgi:hypothetical protein
MERTDGGPNRRYFTGRGLDGQQGRLYQNMYGGGEGPLGAPNAPREGQPQGKYKNPTNSWERHDAEIEKDQTTLRERLAKFDNECEAGSRDEEADLEHAREVSQRPAPTPAQWQGQPYVPPPA